MSIANRPVLSTQGGSINAQNIRWEPGAVYDSALQLVQQPPPPVSFDEEIASNRSQAEQRVGIPDFGVAQPDQPQGNKTATETNVITNVMQQSNDLRARILKGAMSRLYEQSWSLLRQYDRASLDYFWRKQRVSLPDAALDNSYVLRPNGSVDGYSREREIQKLMQLRQLSSGAPWIKTPEIDRKLVELMDAQWVSDIYEPPPQVTSDQAEEQAIENSIMMDGFSPQVKPDDDHLTHLQTLDAFITMRSAQGPPISPPQMQVFMQHMAMHIGAARSDPGYWKAHAQALAPFIQKMQDTMKGLAKQQQAAQGAQASLAALRGGPPPGMGGPPAPGGQMPPGMPTGGAPPPVPSAPMPGQPAGVPPLGGNGSGGLPMG
jgi:hypothetical protein